MVCSAKAVACRKAPGGIGTAISANIMAGLLGSRMISPSTESRAKPSLTTNSETVRRRPSPSLPAPSAAMSRPEAVAVTVMWNGCGVAEIMPARTRSRSSDATISGSEIGHSAMSTISFECARLKPKITPRSVLRAEKVTRRRVSGAQGTMSATSASMRAARSACTTFWRFQSRYARSSRCWIAQPPQAPKCRQGRFDALQARRRGWR